MKKRQQNFTKETPKFTNRQLSKPSLKADAFIDSFYRSFILYNMDKSSKKPLEMKQMNFNIPMIRHTFFNAEEIVPNRSSATFETSFTKRSENNQTVFKTFNNTEFTENDEEYEYSNYLKEYESVIKNSRRKQYVSPQKQHKEMNLLINQFLSDIQPPSETNDKSNKTIITPIKKQNTNVKIEKIDLTSYQSNKSSQKIIVIDNFNSNKVKKGVHQEAVKKQAKSKFIDIAKLNTTAKKSQKNIEKSQKEKEKVKIQVVKVNDLRPKNTSPSPKPKKQAKTVFPEQNFTQMLLSFDKNSPTYKKQQQNHGNYAQSYLKKKLLKDVRPSDSSNTSQKSFQHPSIPKDPSKKPIKIQIDIPLDQLQQSDYNHLPREPKQMYSELDIEGQQIIKVVSQTIRGLLQKNKTVGGKNK